MGDDLICEFEDCTATACRVLFWGPKKTWPCRSACWKHQGETDLSRFRDDLNDLPATPKESHR